MQIIISLLTAILFYKIKLIDDRKSNNFQKFKDYLKRTGKKGLTHGLYEQDVWLEKDVHINLMAQYELSNQGEKYAILDYYKDYVDNEKSRIVLIVLIFLNILYFIVIDRLHVANLISNFMITVPSIILCFKQSQNSLFNNAIINVDNSEIAKKTYQKIEKEIEHKLLKLREKYKVK